MWPTTLDYTTKARTFLDESPIYEWEVGTEHEKHKKGKTRYEVASGGPFQGIKYPLGALVYYKCKGDGLSEPTTKPGLFAGWKLESDWRYKDVMLILDYEAVRHQKHKYNEPLDIMCRTGY